MTATTDASARTAATPAAADADTDADMLDVLIVGAGLSGIGAAWHLQRRCPGKRYAILEARDAIGGTWDLFRYPGVRSDSDMYTLGYAFKPYTGARALADGAAIRDYIADAAREGGIDRHIRYGHKVVAAAWSSVDACWRLEVESDGQRRLLRTRFLYLCSGYYDYDEAHRPRFDGEAAFRGRIVQPQFWPRDLDVRGKRVVVVGSGATAVTLVPALARDAAHVTMLQRSPTYVVSRPAVSGFALRMRRWLPARLAYAVTRWRLIVESIVLYRIVRARPDQAKAQIVAMARRALGPGYDVATHFTPRYKPWDQRLCIVPDGDLFKAIRSGAASVATDHIARFTADGIALASGAVLDADVVVLATGLKLKSLGGIAITVDGAPFRAADAMSYKGMMLSCLPNCVMAFGYTNASWTLKADLTALWVCRLLRAMDRRRVDVAVVRRDAGVTPEPFLDFTSGYVQRGRDQLPLQGNRHPWKVHQNYLQDMLTIRFGRVADGVMHFTKKGESPWI